jgi:hypothetical protein
VDCGGFRQAGLRDHGGTRDEGGHSVADLTKGRRVIRRRTRQAVRRPQEEVRVRVSIRALAESTGARTGSCTASSASPHDAARSRRATRAQEEVGHRSVTHGSGLRVEVDGEVARLTLDAPDRRNAQTPAHVQTSRRCSCRLPEQVRAVVSAARDRRSRRASTAGFSPPPASPARPTSDARGLPPDELDATIAGFQEAFTWLRSATYVASPPSRPTPSVPASSCAGVRPRRRLRRRAVREREDDARTRGPTSAGRSRSWTPSGTRALEILRDRTWVRPDEAVRVGLAPRTPCSDPVLDGAVDALVGSLLAAPADAVRATKKLLAGASWRPPQGQLAAERAAQGDRPPRARRGGSVRSRLSGCRSRDGQSGNSPPTGRVLATTTTTGARTALSMHSPWNQYRSLHPRSALTSSAPHPRDRSAHRGVRPALRRWILAFLVTVVLDALTVVVTPCCSR